eukprot:76686_1
MIDALTRALSEKRRVRMKVRLRSCMMHSWNDFLLNNDGEIDRQIINLVNMANEKIDNFMFIFDFDLKQIKAITTLKKWSRKLGNKKMNNAYSFSLNHKYLYNTDDGYQPTVQLVISNKTCNINGYNEKWIYPCWHCKDCIL